MKVLVERDGFASAVSAAMRASGKANAIPILNNVLLKPNGKMLGIVGTNLDMWMEATVPAEIEGDSASGAITIVGDALVNLVDRMPKGAQITMEWSDGTPGATIKSGRSRYNLQTLPHSDFPNSVTPEDPVRFAMPAKELVAALSAARFAMSKNRSRPWICGIYMGVGASDYPMLGGSKESSLVFVSTDGFNLIRAAFPLPADAKNLDAVILPDTAIPEIVRLATDVDGTIEIAATSTLVSFAADDKLFVTKLISGTFPDYMRVIPPANDRRMTCDCDELEFALGRLRAIDDGVKTKASIADNKLTLTLANHMVGEAEETIEIEWEGEPLVIGIAATALLGILNSMQADQCVMNFGDAAAPVLIQPWRADKVDVTRTYVMMPVGYK